MFVFITTLFNSFRWHPDQNGGCTQAGARFQEIKDAFEEIQRREILSRSSRHAHYTQPPRTPRRKTSQYRYTPQSHSSFYGFRHDGFRGAENSSRASTNRTRASAQWSLWSRGFRHSALDRAIGVGIGVVLTTVMCMGMMASMDSVWRNNNRGKSFDDLMKRLDSIPPEKKHSRVNHLRRDRSQPFGESESKPE